MMDKRITKEDLDACWGYQSEYFAQVLNGEYDLSEAIADLRSLIGTKYDSRTSNKI